MTRGAVGRMVTALGGMTVALCTVQAQAQDHVMDHSMHHGDHQGHGMEPSPQHEHAAHQGHDTPPPQDVHSCHDTHSAHEVYFPATAVPPPLAHDRAADRYFGAASMAAAEAAMMTGHGSASYAKLTFDLAEYQFRNGQDGYRWEAEGWIGDLDRLVVKSKGEGFFEGGLDHGEVQALYAKALDPWWNLQAGVRQDLAPGPVRTHATIGVEGRMPYQLEVQAAAFLSHKGEVTGRVEGSYDQRVTQRLILQPRAELDFSAQAIPDYHLGAGLTSAELGLRLRYEIRREFAPYVGVSWTWLAGDTADMACAEGKSGTERSVVVGLRTWF